MQLSESKDSAPETPAPTSPTQDNGRGWQGSKDNSGLKLPAPFAHLDHASSSSRTSPGSTPRPVWRSTQESLLSESSCPIWPRSATWDHMQAYELPTSEHVIDANDGLLLPTPQAREDGKSPEGHLNMKQHKMGAPRRQITSL